MKILLYVDDSSHWHNAATLVSRFAKADHAHVTVLTTAWLSTHRAKALAEARRILDLPEDQVTLIEHPGLIEYVLPDVVHEVGADLAVIGRLASLDRLTSGLIALLLVRRTPCSIFIVRPHLTVLRKMLVCTEGPQHGGINFRLGARAARALDAEVTVLHVVSQMAITERGEDELSQDTAQFLVSDRPEAQHLRELKHELKQMHIKGRVKVRSGLVVEEILHESHEGGYDLLVIGAHEPRGKQTYLYEDLASILVRSSPVSTLVIRGEGRQE